MNLTIEEMLEISGFQEFQILAGKQGKERIISAVNVIDAPDIHNWIRGGEIFATTGYIVKDNPMELKDIITRMNEKGASALLIKLHRFIDELPKEVLEEADRLNFPLISIPFNISFDRIISPILSELTNRQAKKIVYSEKIHNTFTQLVINNVETKEIIEKLSDLLKEKIAFYDIYFNKLYLSVDDKEFGEEFSSSDLREILNKYEYKIIEIDKEVYGYLIHYDRKIIDEYRDIISEHAITVLKLDIQRKISNYQIETKYREQLLQDILQNNIKSWEDINKRASVYQWEFKTGVSALVVELDNIHNQNTYINKTLYKKLQKMNQLIYSESKKIIKKSSLQILHLILSDRLIFIIQHTDTNDSANKIELFIDELNEKINKEMKAGISIGLGNYKNCITNLYKSYEEAKQSIEIGKIMSEDEHIFSYDQLGVYVLLKDISNNEAGKEFYQNYLFKLIQYDRENNTELLETLKNLADNSWNMKVSAEDLYIHYNTMKYRIRKICDILNLNLKDSKHKFNIMISLKLIDLRSS